MTVLKALLSPKTYTLLILISLAGITAEGQLDATKFRHHTIANPLPGAPEWGTGGFTLADFDGDGDLDVTVSRRPDANRCYWYQNNSGSWKQYLLGTADDSQLGAVTTDMNDDGFPDLVISRIWFENPGNLAKAPATPWKRHVYNGGMLEENHDMVVFDINNDDRMDVVSYGQDHDGGVLRWYDTTDPYNWKFHDIDTDINKRVKDSRAGSNGIHGGFSPGGVGDLDQDGYGDVVLPTGWYRNPGKATGPWTHMPWSFRFGIVPNLYGLSGRSWICDLDSDGDHDVVFTDCDVAGSNGYWIENTADGNFVFHPLPSPAEPTGSFHSLGVADFDMDGDLDIFSGEQEDPAWPGMKTPGQKERGFFWVNTGNKQKPQFKVSIIQTDNPGWHEVQTGDVDGDGDIDLVSKIWNMDGKTYHADYWENLLISDKKAK